MIFMGPGRPVRLLIEFMVDRENLDVARRSVVRKLFDRLDQDKDGRLTAAEGRKVTSLGLGYESISGDAWKELDAQPNGGDGFVSMAEFEPFVTSRFGDPLDVRPSPSRAAHAVRLFERLDTNKDRVISDEELTSTSNALGSLDYDEDETISTVELLPFENPLLPVVPDQPVSVELAVPFVDVTDAKDRSAAIDEIVLLYNRDAKGDVAVEGQTDGLTLEEIGFTQEEFAALDGDGNQQLDRSEIGRMFAEFDPDVEVEVVLPHKQRIRPSISARVLRRHLPIRVRQKARDSLAIVNQNVQLTMRSLSTMSKSYDNVQYYRLQFYRSDADKNKYLDEGEFGQVGLNGASFESVDRDGDGQVLREELIEFVRGSASTAQTQLVMAVGKDGQTLFEAGRRQLRLAAITP